MYAGIDRTCLTTSTWAWLSLLMSRTPRTSVHCRDNSSRHAVVMWLSDDLGWSLRGTQLNTYRIALLETFTVNKNVEFGESKTWNKSLKRHWPWHYWIAGNIVLQCCSEFKTIIFVLRHLVIHLTSWKHPVLWGYCNKDMPWHHKYIANSQFLRGRFRRHPPK